MKHLITYIKEALVVEGGNAVKADPIPAVIAPKVYDEIEKKVHSISKFKDIDMAALGSIGKKADDQTNGDIDVAIKVETKDELNEIVDTCFGDCEINYNTMKTITSFGYPYNIDGYKGIAQVDFMIVKKMDWAKAYYHSPNLKTGESKYKGAVRTAALSCVISCLPVPDVKDEYFEDGTTVKKHWKHTFNTEGVFIQLIDYCGKNGKPVKNGKKIKEFEKLVTNDPTNLVRFIFGDNGTIEDINSIESIWKAIHDPKKFNWGDDVLAAIEKKIIEDPGLEGKLNKEDFPCKFYNPSN